MYRGDICDLYKITLLIILSTPIITMAENPVTDTPVINVSNRQISIKSDSMSHLGINVNISMPVESEEAFVEPMASPYDPAEQMGNSPESIRSLGDSLTGDNASQAGKTNSPKPSSPAATSSTPAESQNTTNTTSQPQNTNSNFAPSQTSVGAQPNFSSPTNQRPQVVQGLLYSENEDDRKEQNKNSPEQASPRAPASSNITPQITATNNSSSKKSKNSPDSQDPQLVQAASTGSSQASSPFGQYSAKGTSGLSPKGNSKSVSAAEKAVKKMWKGYHNGSGSRSGSSRRKANRKGSLHKGSHLSSKKLSPPKGINPHQALEDRLRRMRRGLASTSAGFMSKDSFIFSKICQAYDVYAKNNNLNFGKTKCPQQ